MAPSDRHEGDHGHDHHRPSSEELGHRDARPHAAHPHFTHPLVTESPIPENQFRLDFAYARGDDGDVDVDRYAVEASVEAALTPDLGLELAVPYAFIHRDDGDADGHTDNVEVALKYADYRYGARGVVLGAGLEVGLPTGDDDVGIGDDRAVELEPYVALGYRRDRLEVISFLRLGVPVNERDEEEGEVDLEVGADLSLLYHVSPRVAALLEFNGSAVAAGDADETLLTVDAGHQFLAVRGLAGAGECGRQRSVDR